MTTNASNQVVRPNRSDLSRLDVVGTDGLTAVEREIVVKNYDAESTPTSAELRKFAQWRERKRAS